MWQTHSNWEVRGALINLSITDWLYRLSCCSECPVHISCCNHHRLKPLHHSITAHSIHIPTMKRPSLKARCWKWYAEPVQHGNRELWLLHITSQTFPWWHDISSQCIWEQSAVKIHLSHVRQAPAQSSCPCFRTAAVGHKSRQHEHYLCWLWWMRCGSETRALQEHGQCSCKSALCNCKTWTEKEELWNVSTLPVSVSSVLYRLEWSWRRVQRSEEADSLHLVK